MQETGDSAGAPPGLSAANASPLTQNTRQAAAIWL
jgi:hypothetical protein